MNKKTWPLRIKQSRKRILGKKWTIFREPIIQEAELRNNAEEQPI